MAVALLRRSWCLSYRLPGELGSEHKSLPFMSKPDRKGHRLGDEERRLMHLVPAPAVRLMKRRVLSTPGLNSLMSYLLFVACLSLVMIFEPLVGIRLLYY